MNPLTNPRAAIAALLLALVAPSVAQALPPEGRAVVAALDKARPEATPTRATFMAKAADGAAPEYALRVLIAPDGRVRQDVQRLADGALTTRIWAPGSDAVTEAPMWLRLLAGQEPAAVLRDKGVDTKRTSFAHDGAAVLWVVGAGPHEPELPQVALDRETGRLHRVVERLPVPAGEGAAPVTRAVTVTLEGRYGPEGAPTAGWPRTITIATEGGAVIAFELTALSLGERLRDDAFAPMPAESTGSATP